MNRGFHYFKEAPHRYFRNRRETRNHHNRHQVDNQSEHQQKGAGHGQIP